MTVTHMQVLRSTRYFECYRLLSADGELGRVEAFYFDNKSWLIRYLGVKIAIGPGQRCFLISTVSIGEIDEQNKTIDIELTSRQVENSPPVNTRRPLTRHDEALYYQQLGWKPYWETEPQQGYLSTGDEPAEFFSMTSQPGQSNNVRGFESSALDGGIGHVDDFIIDTRYWLIRYLSIDADDWINKKYLLVYPAWIEHVNWKARMMRVGLKREQLKTAPLFEPAQLIDPDYEARLFRHYQRPLYWQPVTTKDQSPNH